MNDAKKPSYRSEGARPLTLVLLAWLVVALPLGWGLYQSVMKSMPLLHHG